MNWAGLVALWRRGFFRDAVILIQLVTWGKNTKRPQFADFCLRRRREYCAIITHLEKMVEAGLERLVCAGMEKNIEIKIINDFTRFGKPGYLAQSGSGDEETDSRFVWRKRFQF